MTANPTTVGSMTFGLVLPNKGSGVGPEVLDAGASAAADVGWRSAWVTDHLMVPHGDESDEYGWMLEALTALTYVGARHPGLVMGTSVISPAMRDAPLLAKQLATIDVLLGGRLVAGVGVGDSGDLTEFTNLGKEARFRVRGAYVDETVRLWRHLWSGDASRFEGEFHTLDDYNFAPLPVQGASLPIWCGGRSDRALRRTAELGDGYHAAQTSPEDLVERLPRLRAALQITGRPWPVISTRARVRFDGEPGRVYALVGDAEAMIDEVVRFSQVGNDELILVFDGRTPEQLDAEIRRFARDVIAPAAERATA